MCSVSVSRLAVSAPGKIILHGEHSVVHGKKAIACAIESRVTVNVNLSSEEDNFLVISTPVLHAEKMKISIDSLKNIRQEAKSSNELIMLIEKVLKEILSDDLSNVLHLSLSCLLFAYCQAFEVINCEKRYPALSLDIESELPIGAGLGSSAAFNTSVACAFLILSGDVMFPNASGDFCAITDEEDLAKISSLAFEMEKIVHKTPSGIDNSIATYGGAVLFQKGSIEMIKSLPKLNLIIVDTQIPRSTKVLVSGVKDFLDRFPDVVNPILEAMNSITVSAQKILEDIQGKPSDCQLAFDLGKLIVANQHLLSSIGVSHPSLDKVCSIANKHAFPAKLTGAGGGGCAFVLLNGCDPGDEKIVQLRKELESEGFLCREAVLGGPGVMVKYFQ